MRKMGPPRKVHNASNLDSSSEEEGERFEGRGKHGMLKEPMGQPFQVPKLPDLDSSSEGEGHHFDGYANNTNLADNEQEEVHNDNEQEEVHNDEDDRLQNPVFRRWSSEANSKLLRNLSGFVGFDANFFGEDVNAVGIHKCGKAIGQAIHNTFKNFGRKDSGNVLHALVAMLDSEIVQKMFARDFTRLLERSFTDEDEGIYPLGDIRSLLLKLSEGNVLTSNNERKIKKRQNDLRAAICEVLPCVYPKRTRRPIQSSGSILQQCFHIGAAVAVFGKYLFYGSLSEKTLAPVPVNFSGTSESSHNLTMRRFCVDMNTHLSIVTGAVRMCDEYEPQRVWSCSQMSIMVIRLFEAAVSDRGNDAFVRITQSYSTRMELERAADKNPPWQDLADIANSKDFKPVCRVPNPRTGLQAVDPSNVQDPPYVIKGEKDAKQIWLELKKCVGEAYSNFVRSGQNDPDLDTAELTVSDTVEDLENEGISDIQRFDLKVNSKLSLNTIYYILYTLVTSRVGDPVLRKAECLLNNSVVDSGLVDDDRMTGTPRNATKKRKRDLESPENGSLADRLSSISTSVQNKISQDNQLAAIEKEKLAFQKENETYRRSVEEKKLLQDSQLHDLLLKKEQLAIEKEQLAIKEKELAIALATQKERMGAMIEVFRTLKNAGIDVPQSEIDLMLKLSKEMGQGG